MMVDGGDGEANARVEKHQVDGDAKAKPVNVG